MSGFSEAMALGGCKVIVLHPDESRCHRFFFNSIPDEMNVKNVVIKDDLEETIKILTEFIGVS